MTSAEAYKEAESRIYAAKETGQHWLDLGDLEGLEQIPPEIAGLKNLRELGVGNFYYDQEVGEWKESSDRWYSPPQISNFMVLKELVNLQLLDLSLSSITDLQALKGFRFLQWLNLSFAKISDLTPLENITSLKWLDVGCANVSDLKPLAGLKVLQTLTVDGSNVSDLTPLAGLIDLQSLDVSESPVSDLMPLAGLCALNSLTVSDTNVSDLKPLQRLVSIQSLNVNGTKINNLSPLINYNALQILNASHTQVCDLKPLKDLRALQTLDVCNTRVNDLKPLAGLNDLKTLKINHTQVDDLNALAGLDGLQTLDISHTRVSSLEPLSKLNALQTLNMGFTNVVSLDQLKGRTSLTDLTIGGSQVNDLAPLADLNSLSSLTVINTQVSDLAAMAHLHSLNIISVKDCRNLASFEALYGHQRLEKLRAFDVAPARLSQEIVESLPSLKELAVDYISNVPPEVLSENFYADCLDSFRSWAADCKIAEAKDQEVKVFVLGNGTAGKTQICRQLRGEVYDDHVPSTHGVQIGQFGILPDVGEGETRAKLWDFGGQDIYHGTHALFLEGRAVFILVWSVEVEGKGGYEESGLSLHHHGLVYWLDYVRSLAGEEAAVIVVQAKCDRESDRKLAPLPGETGFKRPLPQVTCSSKLGEMDELKAAIRSATRYLLEVHGTYRLPSSWVAVRDQLRQIKISEKMISRARFDVICRRTHGASVPAALLNYLHRSGELFYREGLFKDEIVLDQEWAVRAIYAVLDREGPCQVLRQMGGSFTLPLLSQLVWRDEFTGAEQQIILGMMESCAICFMLAYRQGVNTAYYVIPDMLPLEKDVSMRVEALWRPDLPAHRVTLEYAFLHEGILRQFLCQIGTLAGPDAAYWRYGCCFYDASTHSRARIRAESTATAEAPARGRIALETCDGNSRELLVRLQQALTEIRIGRPPHVADAEGAIEDPISDLQESKPLAEMLKIAPAPTEKPLVYLSYAWGGAKEELADRLEVRLIQAGYEVKRDKRAMRPGDWISDFMREIGQAKRVCVILSEKYMQSPYCMRELLYLYQSSCGEKTDFLNRIVPLVLEDAKLSKTTDRLEHVLYWQNEFVSLQETAKKINLSNLGGASVEAAMIEEFCHHTELMLRHVSDHLMPRGITDIEKDDFAAVIEALKSKG